MENLRAELAGRKIGRTSPGGKPPGGKPPGGTSLGGKPPVELARREPGGMPKRSRPESSNALFALKLLVTTVKSLYFLKFIMAVRKLCQFLI